MLATMMSLCVQKNKSPRIIECPIQIVYTCAKQRYQSIKDMYLWLWGSAYGNAHTLDFKITEITVVDFIWFY